MYMATEEMPLSWQKCPFIAKLEDLKRTSYAAKFEASINTLHEEGRYRSFANLQRRCGSFPAAVFRPPGTETCEGVLDDDAGTAGALAEDVGQEITHTTPPCSPRNMGGPLNVKVFCSNDYLGMGQNKNVLQAAHGALDASGRVGLCVRGIVGAGTCGGCGYLAPMRRRGAALEYIAMKTLYGVVVECQSVHVLLQLGLSRRRLFPS